MATLTQAEIDAFEKMRTGFWNNISGRSADLILEGEQHILIALQIISQQLAIIAQGGGEVNSELPTPLSQPVMSVVGDSFGYNNIILVNLTSVDASSNQNFGTFTAPFTGTAVLLINLAASGVLSMNAQTVGQSQVDTTAKLLDGATITGGQWQTIQLPITEKSVYAFRTSVGCKVTLQVIGNQE
jgi:hypothetical protein